MTHALIAIDPSMRRTGVSVWSYETDPATGRAMPGTTLLLLAASDTRRARDRYETLRREVATVLAGARWWAALERPPPAKAGPAQAPVAALRDWREWLHDLARARAVDAGARFRKPTVAEPLPSVWRAPLGLPTAAPRGFGRTVDERRGWLKQRSIDFCARALKAPGLDDDAADAACLGAWALRCAALGVYPVGTGARRRMEPIRYVV